MSLRIKSKRHRDFSYLERVEPLINFYLQEAKRKPFLRRTFLALAKDLTNQAIEKDKLVL